MTMLSLLLLGSALAQTPDSALYQQGMQAGSAEALGAPTGALGAGACAGAALVSGGSILLCGVGGFPLALGACGVPSGVSRYRKYPVPPGDWMEQPQPYQLGYQEGYVQSMRRSRARASLAPAILGAGLGAAVATGTLIGVGLAIGEVPSFF